MTDKIIQGIIQVKSVSKKKVTIDGIRAHQLRTDDDNNDDWSIEKLESMLSDLIDQNIIELIGDTYKINLTHHWKYHLLLKDPLNLLKRIQHITLLLSRIFSRRN